MSASALATILSILDALLSLLPSSEHSKALDAVGEWLKRRRQTVAKHQAQLDARKGK